MTAQEQITTFIDECLDGGDCFMVSFTVKPTNNYKLFIDSDTGFTLEKAIRINRSLRKKIEDAGLYPEGDYSLEVSSPGIDKPLVLHRQYVKNIGRKLEIELTDPDANGIVGKLLEVNEEKIIIEETPLKKSKKEQEVIRIEIAFADIKSAMVCIEF